MQNLPLLIEQCLANNRLAQKQLYEGYFDYLIRICHRYEPNYQDAAALLNQGFLKILNNLNTYDASKPFLPWIKRIMVNEALDYLRRKDKLSKNKTSLSQENWEVEAVEEAIVEDTDHLIYDDYLEMLANLPHMEKTVFNLFVIDDFGHKAIAALLQISERTSKRYLLSARLLLQNEIKEKITLLKFEK